ncbi:tRNA (N6-threonylcarbamoyladenosine(37)-N6)-methyltransferase TrmO [Cellulomonas terrae]|uniref:tRNA (N6-threonylcarbamoyladenosine(37)-N6)-methyltransferase TrmO n=1 Tax=Cellulomonas terrae TaxID=311234 RepID=A0A511JM18_9CELL|nr:tRNA (N6-threonylcarbamoyladenosine(37)-N6)-methyltransferase TrmO [Cellulomonas terrae]GEL99070.1 tRNA (N6-threonylcarbamoyladenosine(37)-N6)-methyltransferase TrmO [Cellulomonas terrae]
MNAAELRPVGWVRSPVADPSDAARQGDEGAPDVVVELDPSVAAAAADLHPGDDLLLLTWFHLADRATLAVHPRGDTARPVTGVFATRSPDRPNPIGLHRVRLLGVDGLRLHVSGCEAVDGTPVVDVKPVLGAVDER